MSLRSELRKAHEGAEYRTYQCTGRNCEVSAVALANMELWCGTDGCRGRMTQRRKVATSRVVDAILARLTARQGPETPLREPHFDGLEGAVADQILGRGSFDGRQDSVASRSPIRGIAAQAGDNQFACGSYEGEQCA